MEKNKYLIYIIKLYSSKIKIKIIKYSKLKILDMFTELKENQILFSNQCSFSGTLKPIIIILGLEKKQHSYSKIFDHRQRH